MAAITAALITGAAAIGGAAMASSAAKKATKAQQQAAAANNALQREIYGENKANLSPFMERGNLAGDAIADFLGLNGDVGQNEAFENYAKSTGAEYTMKRGTDAITSSAATRGMLESGSTLKAVNQFARDDSQRYVGSYLGQLFGLSGQGMGAASALAGVGQNYAGAVSNNNNAAADATGNGAIAQSNIFSNLLTQLAGSAGYGRGASSYGAGQNPASPVLGHYG